MTKIFDMGKNLRKSQWDAFSKTTPQQAAVDWHMARVQPNVVIDEHGKLQSTSKSEDNAFHSLYECTPWPGHKSLEHERWLQEKAFRDRERRQEQAIREYLAGECPLDRVYSVFGDRAEADARIQGEYKRRRRAEEVAEAFEQIKKVIAERTLKGASGFFMRGDLVRVLKCSVQEASRILKAARRAGTITAAGQWWHMAHAVEYTPYHTAGVASKMHMGLDVSTKSSMTAVQRAVQCGKRTDRADSIRGILAPNFYPGQ